MKNKLIYTLLMICGIATAQNIEVKDIKVEMTKGVQPGVEVFIAGASEDQVRDAIKDNTRKFKGDDERIKKSKERFIDNARIKELSDNDIDIHYVIEETKNGSTLQLFFNMGVVFLSGDVDPVKFKFVQGLATQIAADASKLNFEELVKENEGVLLVMIKDRKEDEDNIKKAQRDIEKAKKEIEEKEKEIKELERKVKDHASLISTQESKLKEFKSKKSRAKK